MPHPLAMQIKQELCKKSDFIEYIVDLVNKEKSRKEEEREEEGKKEKSENKEKRN